MCWFRSAPQLERGAVRRRRQAATGKSHRPHHSSQSPLSSLRDGNTGGTNLSPGPQAGTHLSSRRMNQPPDSEGVFSHRRPVKGTVHPRRKNKVSGPCPHRCDVVNCTVWIGQVGQPASAYVTSMLWTEHPLGPSGE